MKADVLVEVKKEIEKMLEADLLGLAGMPNGSQVLYPCGKRMAGGGFAWISEISIEPLRRMNIQCLLQKY
jgi:hypothetical protein